MLKELGLEEEAIEKIMAEHGKVMEGMTTKAQAEEERKKALEEFTKKWEEEHKPIVVKDSEDYKALEKKYSDLKLDIDLKGAKVKDKYKDFVLSKLAKDKPFEEAIKEVQKQYSEFFDVETDPKKRTPSIKNKEDKDDKEDPSEEDKIKEAFAKAFKR